MECFVLLGQDLKVYHSFGEQMSSLHELLLPKLHQNKYTTTITIVDESETVSIPIQVHFGQVIF